jgi:repressor LexA
MPDLSLRQLEIIRFLQKYREKTGQYATIRDVCKNFGWTSPSTAHQQLKSLEAKGFLERVQITAGVFVWWPTERWWDRA